MRNCLAIAAVCLTSLGGVASAAPVALVNPNFDVAGDLDFVTDTSVTDGVTGYDATLDLFGDFAFYGSNTNGAFFITDSSGNLSGSNLLVRNSSLATASGDRVAVNPGDTATFTFDAVLENGGSGILAAIDFFDSSGSLIASGLTESVFDLGNQTGIANQQTDLSLSGVAPVGTVSLGVRVEATDGQQTFRVDNFRLDVVPVPEPGSLVLAAAGGLALVSRRQR